MIISTTYLRFASICCFLTVFTTLGIHIFFDYGPFTFEEQLNLHNDPMYLINRWTVVVHCLVVLIDMSEVFIIQFRQAPGFSILGIMFFGLFSFTEIFRQLFVLFYLNGLRRNYLSESEELIKSMLAAEINNFSLISLSLFGLFILGFALGNICYGLALVQETKKFTVILGYLLLIWGFFNLMALGNDFWQIEALSGVVEIFSASYQPVIRIIIGIWLFKMAKNLSEMVIKEKKITR